MTAALSVVAAVAAVLAVALAVVTARWQQTRREAAASASEAASASALASAAEASVQEVTARASAAETSAQEIAARASAAEASAEEAAASADAASARARDAEAQVASLQQQLAQAAAPSVPAAGPSADPGGPVIDAVWALQHLQVRLARRDLARISTAVQDTDGPGSLADALGEEVTRIREEIGTPGELEADLPEEPPPAVSLLVLRATETLLPILTRRSDAYDLRLTGGGPQVEVTVACEGTEPDGFPDADTDAVAAAIAGAGGTLTFARTDDGRVLARLVCQTGR